MTLTLPAESSSRDDSRPPSRLALMRKALENRTARGTARSLPTVIPPQNRLVRRRDRKDRASEEL